MKRMTQQRRIILETLQGVTSHPTADELYTLVRERMPRISLGTVYRNLDSLEQDGLVRSENCAGRRRYDGTVDRHGHIQCESCGRLVDIPDREYHELVDHEMNLPDVKGWKTSDVRIEFLGICPECQKKDTN